MSIIEKQAYYYDYRNNEQYATIRINEGICITINTFDFNNNPTGYMNIFFHPNKRLYLDTIYCYDHFRGSGIATMISELADYVLKDYTDYVIRGVYKPGQLSTDRENKIERSKQELDIAARKFYEKAGYQIVEHKKYLCNKNRYNYLTEDDFNLGEDDTSVIVAKQIKPKKYMFYEEDGIIYHINYRKLNIKNYKLK